MPEAEAQAFLVVHLDGIFNRTVFEFIQYLADLCTQEGRDNGGRRFVGPQAVGVGCRSDTGFQQPVEFIDGHQRIDHEGDETQVVFAVLAGREQVDARIGSHRPVAMFTRAVHTHERFFVKQHAEVVAA